MGFRSTFTTEHINLKIPKWFKDKWKGQIFFGTGFSDGRMKGLPMSAMFEFKTYDSGLRLEDDIQKVLAEQDIVDSLELVYFHECGGITKVKFTKDSIEYIEPTGWKATDGVEHDYCYGCSEVKIINSK